VNKITTALASLDFQVKGIRTALDEVLKKKGTTLPNRPQLLDDWPIGDIDAFDSHEDKLKSFQQEAVLKRNKP